ncbi:hypothetical protein KJY78_00735 [Canibacter sp. lx-45]|uniref:hypothetical protein n=1 Tax=Canibacter zhuwentaonis TaxID=2837491 RepID=UPI001BDD7006|nr:hypothetical protein [Canibacter zhuwentaonis]MBT1034881.1 hypothetical protein [Canibacter zhuwentaonis]
MSKQLDDMDHRRGEIKDKLEASGVANSEECQQSLQAELGQIVARQDKIPAKLTEITASAQKLQAEIQQHLLLRQKYEEATECLCRQPQPARSGHQR